MELTPGELQEILRVFVDSDLQELQLQVGDVTLAVSKRDSDGTGMFPVAQVAAPQATASPARTTAPAEPAAPTETEIAEPAAGDQVDRSGLHALRSPLVGVFYRRPGPDQPPYVEVGDAIKVGDPVCTISVMKMYTEVGADSAGRVVEICVENETLVEHGQVLMYIDPRET